MRDDERRPARGTGGSTKRRRRSPVRGSIRSTSAPGGSPCGSCPVTASVFPSGEKRQRLHEAAAQLVRLAHRPPGGRVEDPDRAALSAGRHEPLVGTHRHRVQGPRRRPRNTPSAAGLRMQHGEQVAARRRGVVELHAGAGEQQRMVEALARERLGAQALGVGGQGGIARVAALRQREQARGDGDRKRRRGAGEQRAQAAIRAPAVLGLALARQRGSRRGTRVRAGSARRRAPVPSRARTASRAPR